MAIEITYLIIQNYLFCKLYNNYKLTKIVKLKYINTLFLTAPVNT